MANFPTSLDTYINLTDNTDEVVAADNNDHADAIEVIEVKVGITDSAVTSTHNYILTNLPSQDTTAEITNLNVDLLNSSAAGNWFEYRAGDIVVSSITTPYGDWTEISASYDDTFMRISSGTPLSSGGADTHDHGGNVGNHTLTIAEMPSHTHTYDRENIVGQSRDTQVSHAWADTYVPTSTGSAGSSDAHNHTLSASDSFPAYIQIKLFQKD